MNCYEGLTVLVTGDSGFKGSWLSIWLTELGAKVVGYSLPPSTQPNLFTLTQLEQKIQHVEGDLRDLDRLRKTVSHYCPDIIFHLAAQAIVLEGYEKPVDTFATNALGTIHLLEAVRTSPSVQAVVIVTTDKCYENREWSWGYRENDTLGGHDPYSASKAMAELAVASYRHSFFQNESSAVLATARAGNVIGGGDFSAHRILPDAMRALLKKQPICVRNPASVRPWMHVLDPLCGYLTLGAKLLQQGKPFAEAWNFGPAEPRGISVQELVEKTIALWGDGEWVDASQPNATPEKAMLRLNWDKAAHALAWKPNYSWEEAIAETVDWFKAYQNSQDLYALSVQHIEQYCTKNSPTPSYAI
jgi:CDP-glucose 4,6-dehydratase